MNGALLGANCSPSSDPTDQMVVPPVGLPSESAQGNAAPPHAWTSMPRWRLYQACSAGASFALKKMPPMPVTRFMRISDGFGSSTRWSASWPLLGSELPRDQSADVRVRRLEHP